RKDTNSSPSSYQFQHSHPPANLGEPDHQYRHYTHVSQPKSSEKKPKQVPNKSEQRGDRKSNMKRSRTAPTRPVNAVKFSGNPKEKDTNPQIQLEGSPLLDIDIPSI